MNNIMIIIIIKIIKIKNKQYLKVIKKVIIHSHPFVQMIVYYCKKISFIFNCNNKNKLINNHQINQINIIIHNKK